MIARIELGRMPLRYGDALRLLQALIPSATIPAPINPLWLAEGTWPVQLEWPFLLPKPEAIGLSPSTPFSKFVSENRGVLGAMASDPPEPELPESWLAPYLQEWTRLRSQAARVQTGIILFGCVVKFSAERLAPESRQAAKVLRKVLQIEKKNDRKALTQSPRSENMRSVRMEMESLIAEARSLASERGKKTQLANALGVSSSRITEWLSGVTEPDGRNTLKLLNWVQEQQSLQQSKTPSHASPRPGAKTRHPKSHNENERANPED